MLVSKTSSKTQYTGFQSRHYKILIVKLFGISHSDGTVGKLARMRAENTVFGKTIKYLNFFVQDKFKHENKFKLQLWFYRAKFCQKRIISSTDFNLL